MKKILLAMAAVVAMFAFVNSPASAAPMTTGKNLPSIDSQIIKVHGNHHICARGPVWRWGGRVVCHRHRGWAVRRCAPGACMSVHPGCWHTRKRCRDRWGYGHDYRRCVRRHGC
jgi:hypothetical protein